MLFALAFVLYAGSLFAAPDIVVKQDWDGAVVPNNGSVSFPWIYSGQSNSRRFRIQNVGTTALTISNPAALIATPYRCFSQTEVPAATIAAGGTSYFTLKQQCTSSSNWTTLYSITVAISSNDPDTPNYQFTAGGSVVPTPGKIDVYRAWDNVLIANGGSYTFPDPMYTYTAYSRQFRITNNGAGDLTLNPTEMVSGACFSEIESTPTFLHPGESGYLRVRFMCATAGTFSGTITVASNDPDNQYYIIHLQATALQAPDPEIDVTRVWDGAAQLDGSSFTFPTTGINQSDIRTFRVSNNGNGPLAILNRQSVVSGACFSQLDDLPGTISAQSSATFRVRFGCASAGTYQGAVSIQNNDASEGAYTIHLAGTIIRNGAEFVSQSIPSVMVASMPYDISVTMRNSGGTTWTAAGNYRLGIQPDAASATWNIGRIYLPSGVSVAPGASYTFTARVYAPSTPGTYSLQWRMVEELVEWFGVTTPAATVTVQSNGATFVSQSCPSSMNGGVQYDCSVTMRNSGTTTWTAANSYRLGIQPDAAASTWGINRVYLPAGTSVAPGANYTFTYRVTAPATSGTYALQWRMVQEMIEWFGATTPALNINVAANDATFVSQTGASSMTAGQTYPVTVKMHNSGATTWTAAGGYKLAPVVANNPWGARIALPSAVSVAPGADYTFSFNVTAPATAGNYAFQWQMVQEPSAFFGQRSASRTIAVTAPQPPSITSVTPTDVAVGTISTITITGANFTGATVSIGAPADGHAAPLAQNAIVNASGTEITVQIDARNSAVEGFYGVVVQSGAGQAAGALRVLPNRPVIDAYTPSQASWGDVYYVALFGANLDGATVEATSSSVELYGVESTEGAITGLLYVTPGSGTVSTNLRVSRAGAEAVVPIELRDRQALTKTSRLTESAPGSVDGVYIQDPVQTLQTTPLNKTFSCFFHSERARSHSSVITLLRNPLTHKPDSRLLDGLQYGESRLFESLIAIHNGAMSLSIDIVCGDSGWEVYFCAELYFAIEIVGAGGQEVDASACTGSSNDLKFSGSGFVNFAYEWGDSGTGSKCSTVEDVSPDPIYGNRQGRVTLNNCCTDPLEIDTEFTLASNPGVHQQYHARLAEIRPSSSCTISCDHKVEIRAFIPFEAVHIESEGCLQYHMGIWVRGDNRGFSAAPGGEGSRMEHTFCSSTGMQEFHCGESMKFAQDGMYVIDGYFADHIKPEALADPFANHDCHLMHYRGRTTPDVTLTQVASNDPRVKIWRSVAAGAIPDDLLAPDIDWDLTVKIDENYYPPQIFVTGKHDGFPSYEVYVDGKRVYGFDASINPDPTALFGWGDIAVDCLVGLGQAPCYEHN